MNNEKKINNLDKFNKQCENDFRNMLVSFLKIFKKKNIQSGGVGSKGSMYTGLNINLLNQLINNKTGKFNGILANNSKRKQPFPVRTFNNLNNNKSQKLTVTPLSDLNIPNFSQTKLPQIKLPNVKELRKNSISECQIYDY